MIQKIDSKYYQKNQIQVMIPISQNCTFFGPNGVQFHTCHGQIFINDYLEHPDRELFPFYETPIHEDKLGVFSNQIFELNKPYLGIYTMEEEYQFRYNYFFKEKNILYMQTETSVSLGEIGERKMTEEELERTLKQTLSSCNFFCILDRNGELHEFYKHDTLIDIPLEGVLIYGNICNVNASFYNIQALEKDQILMSQQNIIFDREKYSEIENSNYNIEPDIKKM